MIVREGDILITALLCIVRLKARARQLDAADEKDMAAILKAGS